MKITAEFKGGALDGTALHGDAIDPYSLLSAEFLYQMTHDGRIGARFKGFSPRAIKQMHGAESAGRMPMTQMYELAERRELDGGVHLVCIFVPPRRR